MSLYSSKIKFKPRQRRLAVCMVTDFVSPIYNLLCFEQPVASFLVCFLIFIEY
ncbi:hypothetical protein PNI0197_00727 [Streptococcus pneumoniae PNI0197]|nr:hypothetical protein PNI0197_00727 [Streptococcus pneumoniae PNI0197]